ncbi:MAG: zinc-ribbon domain-containing protein [Cypionkella sp.]
MRLQCPNCDAEYEVDASAIPYEGRDVQCSNCGHGWFQTHPDFEAEYDVENALYDPPPPLPQAARPAGEAVAAPYVPTEAPKREIDPEVLRILREEVAYEAAKRAVENKAAAEGLGAAGLGAADVAAARDAPADSAPPAVQTGDDFSIEAELDKAIMSQPDGASADVYDAQVYDADAAAQDEAQGAQRSPSVVARRVARLKGAPPPHGDAATGRDISAPPLPYDPQPVQPPQTQTPQPPHYPPRQPQQAALDTRVFEDTRLLDALPQQGRPAAGAAKTAAPRRKGRRAGVYTSLLVSMGAAAAYIFGPDIAANAPQVAAPLERYVSSINSLRDQLDARVPQVLDQGTAAAHQLMDFTRAMLQHLRDFIAAQGWI